MYVCAPTNCNFVIRTIYEQQKIFYIFSGFLETAPTTAFPSFTHKTMTLKKN